MQRQRASVSSLASIPARDYALRSHRRSAAGGNLLISAEAQADAIISVIPKGQDTYGEREVIVDRRRLGSVRVLVRFL
jgi:hypothetical protein